MDTSCPMTNAALWLALQICDSSFPGGSFSHSNGLESAFHHGLISDEASLMKFIAMTVEQAMCQLYPVMKKVHNVSLHKDAIRQDAIENWLEVVCEMDSLCNCLFTNSVSKRASTTQGRCLLKVASEVYTEHAAFWDIVTTAIRQPAPDRTPVEITPTATATECHEQPSPKRTPHSNGHFAPIFGAVCGLNNIPWSLAQRMFARCLSRDLLSAAARLNIIGPLQGARLQGQLRVDIEALLLRGEEERGSEGEGKDAGVVEAVGVQARVDGALSTEEGVSSKRRKTSAHAHVDASAAAGCGRAREEGLCPAPAGPEGLDKRLTKEEPMPVTTAPLLELLQARHDLLYSRLFNS